MLFILLNLSLALVMGTENGSTSP